MNEVKPSDPERDTFAHDIGSRVRAAENLSHNYRDDYRYTAEALESCMGIFSNNLPDGTSVILGIGSGTGVPEQTFTRLRPDVKVIELDISLPMLRAAKSADDLEKYFVVGESEQLPLQSESLPAVLLVLMFHLTDQLPTLAEISRVLEPDGTMALVATEPKDLQTQVFHKYFPSFAALEASRHRSISSITEMAAPLGLQFSSLSRFPFTLKLPAAVDLADLMRSKPFFGLQQLNEADFTAGMKYFDREIRSSYGDSEILSDSALSIAIFRKH